jgi:hypothetical protein
MSFPDLTLNGVSILGSWWCCKPSNPKNLLSQELQSLFWFLSTFPSLAGLNHLLDAEGNEVAQQDEQEDSWLAVLEPLQIGLAWSYISYHFLSWASLLMMVMYRASFNIFFSFF